MVRGSVKVKLIALATPVELKVSAVGAVAPTRIEASADGRLCLSQKKDRPDKINKHDPGSYRNRFRTKNAADVYASDRRSLLLQIQPERYRNAPRLKATRALCDQVESESALAFVTPTTRRMRTQETCPIVYTIWRSLSDLNIRKSP